MTDTERISQLEAELAESEKEGEHALRQLDKALTERDAALAELAEARKLADEYRTERDADRALLDKAQRERAEARRERDKEAAAHERTKAELAEARHQLFKADSRYAHDVKMLQEQLSGEMCAHERTKAQLGLSRETCEVVAAERDTAQAERDSARDANRSMQRALFATQSEAAAMAQLMLNVRAKLLESSVGGMPEMLTASAIAMIEDSKIRDLAARLTKLEAVMTALRRDRCMSVSVAEALAALDAKGGTDE